jgi:rhamnosyltransferase
MITRGMIRDTWAIAHDGQYSFKRKLYWLVINPVFHIEKWRGVRRAYAVSVDDSGEKYSLEASRAKKT